MSLSSYPHSDIDHTSTGVPINDQRPIRHIGFQLVIRHDGRKNQTSGLIR